MCFNIKNEMFVKTYGNHIKKLMTVCSLEVMRGKRLKYIENLLQPKLLK